MFIFLSYYIINKLVYKNRIYDVITEMKLFLCFNLVYYIVQNLYTTLRVKDTIDVSIFSHFLAVMRYRDAFGMISECLRNLYCPQKMGLECACEFKIMSTKSGKKNMSKYPT